MTIKKVLYLSGFKCNFSFQNCYHGYRLALLRWSVHMISLSSNISFLSKLPILPNFGLSWPWNPDLITVTPMPLLQRSILRSAEIQFQLAIGLRLTMVSGQVPFNSEWKCLFVFSSILTRPRSSSLQLNLVIFNRLLAWLHSSACQDILSKQFFGPTLEIAYNKNRCLYCRH